MIISAQQADAPDRISPVIIATTPARKIPVDTRPVILVVRLTRIPEIEIVNLQKILGHSNYILHKFESTKLDK